MANASMYAVSAIAPGGRQIPTFYLLANVQGIVSETHAAEIAAKIVPVDSTIHVVATSMHAHPELLLGARLPYAAI